MENRETEKLYITYEIRRGHFNEPDTWERINLDLPTGLSAFEAKSMAAGLRAESRNIRDVHVIETSKVTRDIG